MRKAAPFFVLMAGILWGVIGFFVRDLNAKGLNAMDIMMIRSVTTVVMLFIYLVIFDRKLLRIRIKDLWCFLGTGLCSVVFFNYCYFRTMTLTSLSVAAVLLYTAPALERALAMRSIRYSEDMRWIGAMSR